MLGNNKCFNAPTEYFSEHESCHPYLDKKSKTNQHAKPIPYSKHSVNEQDIDAVLDVLQHHFLTQGDKVPEFEDAICEYTGAKFCTAVNSGTSALHVACLALGVGANDIVWTSPNSFAASANCALYCGAQIDFVDIDPVTRNMSTVHLEHKLLDAQQKGALPKVIVVVHFAGEGCDMQTIASMCRPLNIKVIEDAAHAFGAEYLCNENRGFDSQGIGTKNSKVGNCAYSDFTIFSFHPVKTITTAEGGAVVTNNIDLAKACELFSKHGITRDENELLGASHGPWYYQQKVLGFNYRLSDLQAALGISQLKRVDEFVNRRRDIAKRYFDELAGLPIKLPRKRSLNRSSWHLFMIELIEHDRASIYQKLHDVGICVNVHYIPIHCHPYYQSLGFRVEDFPSSVMFYEKALTLPLYASLSDSEQTRVINTLKDILK